MVITKDFGDRGLGLILNHPFPTQEVVVGFWLNTSEAQDPWFFLGKIQRSLQIGGGFWLLGVEMQEFMNERWPLQLQPLLPLAHKLVPPAPAPRDQEELMAAGAGL